VITLDGNLIASQVKSDIKNYIDDLRKKAGSSIPGLGTILVGDDPASQSYVAGKHRDCSEVGINSIRIDLPASASDQEIRSAIDSLNRDPRCTGFLLQLPLPDKRDHQQLLEAIDPKKDCDGLHPVNLGKLVAGVTAPRPCTPLGIIRLVRAFAIELSGARIAIVGRGPTVGRPLALMLSDRDINATVTVIHTGTRKPEELIKGAEIVVAAVGKKWIIRKEMIGSGATVVDVGLTRDGRKLVGDVHPDVAEVAAALSPVPGGVGPMTRAMLLENIIRIHRGEFEEGLQ
jgi:methylenetetrahydrofolate dehydrogenase (NADP+)/methenyltetrahydrofolate cyclohydrolase